MGLNITHTNSFQFESRENLRNAAHNLLNRQGASKEAIDKIFGKTVFGVNSSDVYVNPQLSVIKASSQISVNNSLKETLKYLKNHSAKKIAKQYVLGELWEELNKETSYDGELLNFEVDSSLENIFAA